jgi:hypothetical protein
MFIRPAIKHYKEHWRAEDRARSEHLKSVRAEDRARSEHLKSVRAEAAIKTVKKVRQSRYRPGVAQRVPGS